MCGRKMMENVKVTMGIPIPSPLAAGNTERRPRWQTKVNLTPFTLFLNAWESKSRLI